MKKNIFIAILMLLSIYGCEKNATIKPKDYPFLIAKNVIQNDSTGATFSAKVLDMGTEEIIDFGFILKCSNAEYKLSLLNKTALDNFTLRISTIIEKDKEYSYRAYIKSPKHTIYSNEIEFISQGSKSPEIYSFYPKEGFDNTSVTITGSNFGFTEDNFSVLVNDIPSEIVLLTNDSVTFKTPNTSFYGNAKITLKAGPKTINANEKFKILGPQIDSLSIISGHSGEKIAIWGKNLKQNGQNTELFFGTFPAAITGSTDSKIESTIPFSYYYNDLLIDKSVIVQYKNGLKTSAYNNSFTIKKSWEKKRDPQFMASWQEKCFSYKGKGYFLDINFKKLYEYDAGLDTWSSISDYPGERSESNLFTVFGDKLFKLGGSNYLGKMYTFWEYDFLANGWTKREDTQFSFYQAASFVLNNTLFIITDNNQVWSYGNNNSFRRMNDFPEQVILFISYVSNDKAYMINSGQTWEYDFQNDNWVKKSSNPFKSSYYYGSTIGFSLYGTCYVLQSGTDLYKFDQQNEKWILTSIYPNSGQSSFKSTFVTGDQAFIAALRSSSPSEYPLLYKYQEH